jgi:hypothetical protein
LKSVKFVLITVIAGVLAGCAPAGSKTLLTVDFQKGQTLKYKFTSIRSMTVEWGKGYEMTSRGVRNNSYLDSMVMFISYTPVDVDPYGVSTIKAVCEKAEVRHEEPMQNQSQPDAAISFSDKTWTFTVDATGRIADSCGLQDVIRQAGKKAFRGDTGRGLIKEPDMIYDFIASQWFLWDSVSSIKKPLEGVNVGQMWKSRLSVPSPMFLFTARDVNYTLAEIRQDPNSDKVAVINSTYSPFFPAPSEWPLPYTEKFMMSGTFGFLRDYKVLDLKGGGQEFFNIDAGRIERSKQEWIMHVSSAMPLDLGPKPQITVNQTLTMELLGPVPVKTSPAPAKKQGR